MASSCWACRILLYSSSDRAFPDRSTNVFFFRLENKRLIKAIIRSRFAAVLKKNGLRYKILTFAGGFAEGRRRNVSGMSCV